MDRVERGIKVVDCYLIASHGRPVSAPSHFPRSGHMACSLFDVHKVQDDGSLSEPLSAWLLNLKTSVVPKWSANGRGRTQAAFQLQQENRAAGTAAINGPTGTSALERNRTA